ASLCRLFASGGLRRRMRGPPPLDGCAWRARPLLPDRAQRPAPARHSAGRSARDAKARECLHDYCHRTRLTPVPFTVPVEVDCQDTRRGRADVLYIVHSMCGSPEDLARAKNIGTARRLLGKLAFNYRQDDRARVIMQSGLGPRIPAVIADLQIGWQRNIGGGVLQ